MRILIGVSLICLFLTFVIAGLGLKHGLFAQTALPGKEIRFTKGAWTDIIQKAKKSHKYIFVDVSASWCLPCRQLEMESFRDSAVAAYYNDNFISFAIDAEKGSGIELADRWKIAAYPTLLYFTPDGRMVMRQTGFVDSKRLLDLSKQALSRN